MRLLSVSLALLSAAALATAQDHLTVPISNPAQPVTLKVHVVTGSITVTPGAANQVVVDTQQGPGGRRHQRERDAPPPGMHRIDTGSGLEVEEDHNVVTINHGVMDNSSLTIQVPPNTSVELKSLNGEISVTGLSGDINVESTNAAITAKGITGAVVAHTLNGSINVSVDRAPADKPMSFTTLNGSIDVSLPADTKARLRLKSNRGNIFTDFDVKMEPDNNKPVVENNRDDKGKYKIVVDRGVYGSINGGGPEYLFQTFNGTITIHKK